MKLLSRFFSALARLAVGRELSNALRFSDSMWWRFVGRINGVGTAAYAHSLLRPHACPRPPCSLPAQEILAQSLPRRFYAIQSCTLIITGVGSSNTIQEGTHLSVHLLRLLCTTTTLRLSTLGHQVSSSAAQQLEYFILNILVISSGDSQAIFSASVEQAIQTKYGNRCASASLISPTTAVFGN